MNVVFKQGYVIWGPGESDRLMFAQLFGLDKLDTRSIVLNIKGALFDTGEQTMVSQMFNIELREMRKETTLLENFLQV